MPKPTPMCTYLCNSIFKPMPKSMCVCSIIFIFNCVTRIRIHIHRYRHRHRHRHRHLEIHIDLHMHIHKYIYIFVYLYTHVHSRTHIPVVPARGGAEVAGGFEYKTLFIYGTCMPCNGQARACTLCATVRHCSKGLT